MEDTRHLWLYSGEHLPRTHNPHTRKALHKERALCLYTDPPVFMLFNFSAAPGWMPGSREGEVQGCCVPGKQVSQCIQSQSRTLEPRKGSRRWLIWRIRASECHYHRHTNCKEKAKSLGKWKVFLSPFSKFHENFGKTWTVERSADTSPFIMYVFLSNRNMFSPKPNPNTVPKICQHRYHYHLLSNLTPQQQQQFWFSIHFV